MAAVCCCCCASSCCSCCCVILGIFIAVVLLLMSRLEINRPNMNWMLLTSAKGHIFQDICKVIDRPDSNPSQLNVRSHTWPWGTPPLCDYNHCCLLLLPLCSIPVSAPKYSVSWASPAWRMTQRWHLSLSATGSTFEAYPWLVLPKDNLIFELKNSKYYYS